MINAEQKQAGRQPKASFVEAGKDGHKLSDLDVGAIVQTSVEGLPAFAADGIGDTGCQESDAVNIMTQGRVLYICLDPASQCCRPDVLRNCAGGQRIGTPDTWWQIADAIQELSYGGGQDATQAGHSAAARLKLLELEGVMIHLMALLRCRCALAIPQMKWNTVVELDFSILWGLSCPGRDQNGRRCMISLQAMLEQ